MISIRSAFTFVFQIKHTIAKILAEKHQGKGSSFQHTLEQSTVSDTVCSTKGNNMHVTLFDSENSESTSSDLGDFSPQSMIMFVGNKCTPGRKSLPKSLNTVDDCVLHTDNDDDGEITEQQLNDSTVSVHLDIISNLESEHKFIGHAKHMTGAVDSKQALFKEMTTPVFFVFDVENRTTESCHCRNSLCLKDHTTIEVCEGESFRISRGVDETVTNLQVSILPHKTCPTGHNVTTEGNEQCSSIVNMSELKPLEAVTNIDAASKSDMRTHDDNKFHNQT